MSKNNELFEEILMEIVRKTPLNKDGNPTTEEDIAILINRNKGFIAQVRSRYKKGTPVPDKVIDLLRLHFAIEKLPAKKRDEISLLKAQVKILTHVLIELKHTVTKESTTKILLEIEKMTLQEVEQQPGAA